MEAIASKTNYLSVRILEHVTGAIPFEMPATLWLALFDTDPGADGTAGAEVSGAGYRRAEVRFGPVGPDGTVVNSAMIEFPEVISSWGTLGGFGLMDAPADGNMLYHGPMLQHVSQDADRYAPRVFTPLIGDEVIIRPGQLVIMER